MNVFGKRERSWRKTRKRGVSPIIATILLVAITVVLAAVLYVLISGLTHGTGSAPLGTNFSWGAPFNVTSSPPPQCTGTVYCYSVEIAGVGGGITMSSVQLAARTSAGATIALLAADTISLVSPSVASAVATYSVTTSSWTVTAAGTTAGFAGALGGGFSIVIQTAATHAAGLFGYYLVAIGVNGYSGTVPTGTTFS